MKIRFYANMRTIAGQEIFEIAEFNGHKTLRNVLNMLIKDFPHLHPYLFNEDESLRPDVPIFVNGRNPRLEQSGVDTPLGPEDIISLFSPIASGKMNVEVMRAAA